MGWGYSGNIYLIYVKDCEILTISEISSTLYKLEGA